VSLKDLIRHPVLADLARLLDDRAPVEPAHPAPPSSDVLVSP
jgi:hypothetical protein